MQNFTKKMLLFEEAYLNTVTNNCADWPRGARGRLSQRKKEPFPDENYLAVPLALSRRNLTQRVLTKTNY